MTRQRRASLSEGKKKTFRDLGRTRFWNLGPSRTEGSGDLQISLDPRIERFESLEVAWPEGKKFSRDETMNASRECEGRGRETAVNEEGGNGRENSGGEVLLSIAKLTRI